MEFTTYFSISSFLATILFHVAFIVFIGSCDKPVAPANGSINSTGSNEGDTVTYFCNRGYNLSGDLIRTCQSDGEWSGAQPECIRMLNTALKCRIADMTIVYILGVLLLSRLLD